jgi:O-antigen/teichoic acid export membrane protein
MKKYKSFTKDVGILSISETILRLKSLIFLPIITKALGPSDYGIYTTLIVTVTLLITVANFNVESAILRFFSSDGDKKKCSRDFFSILISISFLSILAAVVMFFSADFLAETIFGAPNSAGIIRLASLLVPLGVLKPTVTYFRAKQKLIIYSGLNVLDTLGGLGLASFFLISGYDLVYVILSLIIFGLLTLTISLIGIIRDIGISKPDFRFAYPYLKFSFPLMFGAISTTVLNLGDRFIIGLNLGSSSVGVYAVAYSLGSIILFFLHPINTALKAPLSKAYDKKELKEVSNYLKYSIKYFLMFAIPATIALAILSEPITKTLSTKAFTLDVPYVTILVAISNIAFALYTINTAVFFLVKKTKKTASFVIIGAVVNVILNIILIPIFGITGAAFSTFLCFTGLFITSAISSHRYIKMSLDYVFTFKCIIASVIMGLLIVIISPIGWVMLLLTSLLGAALYFILLYLLRAFTETEKEFFLLLLRREPTQFEIT